MAAKSEIDPQLAAPARSQINVVLFSGGSGTQSITAALQKHPQISLKILINAYDDGHSTGRLRRFVPGMLGPSDVRKNLGRLMPHEERSEKSLALVSDFRLPVGVARGDARRRSPKSPDAAAAAKRCARSASAALPPIGITNSPTTLNAMMAKCTTRIVSAITASDSI